MRSEKEKSQSLGLAWNQRPRIELGTRGFLDFIIEFPNRNGTTAHNRLREYVKAKIEKSKKWTSPPKMGEEGIPIS